MDLARKVNMHKVQYYRYESGGAVPHLTTTLVLAKALGVSLAEFDDLEL